MRRLPGPAVWRLSEGGHTPEALSELFRDWQRTQTQSSVTAPRSPRPQMDVWFCKNAGTLSREAYVRSKTIPINQVRALRSAPQDLAFSLDR